MVGVGGTGGYILKSSANQPAPWPSELMGEYHRSARGGASGTRLTQLPQLELTIFSGSGALETLFTPESNTETDLSSSLYSPLQAKHSLDRTHGQLFTELFPPLYFWFSLRDLNLGLYHLKKTHFLLLKYLNVMVFHVHCINHNFWV